MISPFNLVYAVGRNCEFGCNNITSNISNKIFTGFPWGHISEDMKYFSQLTTNQDCENIVIMGKNTFESIGKPLSKRINIVLSTSGNIKTDNNETNKFYHICKTLEEASALVQQYKKENNARKVFIIGGVSLLEKTAPYAEKIYETLIEPKIGTLRNADIFLDRNHVISNRVIENQSRISTADNQFFLTFTTYSNKNHPETSYLNLLSRILSNGIQSENRTGIDTISVWGEQLKVPMYDQGFPLLTTKTVPFKAVIQELFFFISGKTDSKVLEDVGVNIWKGNSSRSFLDKQGLFDLKEGEIGDLYPFHWRHFGAQRVPNKQLELGEGGVDQLKNVIEDIKTVKQNPSHPKARRLIVTSWNPETLHKAPLSACHMMFQFQVQGNRLNCAVTFRSWDVPVGGGFNIASYSLLTYMIGYLTGLTPGDLVISANDCHIYTNVLSQVKTQLERSPRKWPRLEIVGKYHTIDEFHPESFILCDYNPHPVIKMPMAV